MSGDDNSNDGNRTVFRPSPLSGLGKTPPPAPPPAAPPPPAPAPAQDQAQPSAAPPPSPPAAAVPPPPASAQQTPQRRLADDDIAVPATPRDIRTPLVTEAGPILALTASIRSGRARITMPDFHREASAAIASYDAAIASHYSEEVRAGARYALCATVDDIAQNLPNMGQDGAEWARRGLVTQFEGEAADPGKFFQLVDEAVATPEDHAEQIELYLACLAAGYEGQFRTQPDGKAQLKEIVAKLYGALTHPRGVSLRFVSPQWVGFDAPLGKVGLGNRLALVAAAVAVALLAIFIVLRLMLGGSADEGFAAVGKLTPDDPLRLARVGAPLPDATASAQLEKLRASLSSEIRQGLVKVEEDSRTVRVRTTVGKLFESASDELEPGRAALFGKIASAIDGEPGTIVIEGHADSDRVSSLRFADNVALSQARAETVRQVMAQSLRDPGRLTAKGFGDNRPVASNDTAAGKALNRRVEVVIQRQR